jgi:hypothetical protein
MCVPCKKLIWFVNFASFCNGQNLGWLRFFVRMHKLLNFFNEEIQGFLWLFMGFSHDQNLNVLVNKWLQFLLLWDLMMVRRSEKDLQVCFLGLNDG